MTCGSIRFPNVPEPHPSGHANRFPNRFPPVQGNRSEPNALDDIHDERRPWRLVRAALPRDPAAAVCLGELRFRTQVPVAHVTAALQLLDGHGLLHARRRNGGLLYWFSDTAPRPPPAQLSLIDDVPGTTNELHDEIRGTEPMPILAKRPERDYTPCPAGLFQAVCVDAVDLGDVETQWGRQHKAQLKWQVNETLPDGRRFLVSRKYTISLHPKSLLRLHLESWRGRAFTDHELDNGFDLEKLIGANCMLTIVHTAMKDGGTWADVKAIAPLLKGLPRLEPVDYKRATPVPPVADDVDDEDPEPVPF